MVEASDLFVSRYLADTRTIEELILVAMTRNDDDDALSPGWEALIILHAKASREVLQAAQQLANSDNPAEHILAADIVAQLGHIVHKPDTLREERLSLLINLLENDTDPIVLRAAGIGLGHMQQISAIPALTALKRHPSQDVRFGVAFGLAGLDDDRAIATLIDLTADSDEAVRDWATFGLGALSERDTPEIREAFVRRLEDPNERGDAYGEAVAGLAKRHDDRVFGYVVKAIRANQAGPLIFEAAQDLADPRLLPDLLRLKAEHGDEYQNWEGLDDVIAACQSLSSE